MALLDLSLVTSALQTVMTRRVKSGLIALSQPASVVNAFTVSALPPDLLTGDATVGLYLYHFTEDAASKNLPSRSADTPPVRYVPMGLNLFFQVVSHSALLGENGAMTSQRLFGLAVKSLHDYAILTNDTVIDGFPVFPTELQGTDNRFHVILQAIPASEAAQYWTAGTQSIRLAAYYQVSAVLLEPDPPTLYSGRVLRYGVHAFVRGTPRLDAARCTMSFRVPGDTTDTQVEVQPAEVPVGAQMILYGIDLAADQTTLFLRGPGWANSIQADWNISATDARVFVTLQPEADTQTILPGIYSASVQVQRKLSVPGGGTQIFSQTSNEVPFLVAPTVTTPAAATIASADINGMVVIQGRVFQHPQLAPENLSVVVGPGALPRETGATLSAGNFEVVDGTTLVPPVALDDPTLPFVIRFRFPIAGVNTGDVVPLRVVINGAENAPRWVMAP